LLRIYEHSRNYEICFRCFVAKFVDSRQPRKMTDKSKKNSVDESIRQIYDGGEPGDLYRVARQKDSRAKKYLLGLIIFLLVALAGSWAVFFLMGRRDFGGKGVTLEFVGPNEVISGGAAEYTLKYKNGETLSLGESSIEVKMPKNFVASEADPAAGPDGFWRVGTIAPDADGEIKFKGKILGNLGDSVVWQAILTYRPANFNADFERVATYPAVIKDSLLGISAEGPDKIIPGEVAEYKISFQNKSEEEVDNIELRATYPVGFIFKEALSAPTGGNNLWAVGKLQGGANSALTLRGSFAGETEGKLEFGFSIGIKKDNAYLKQAESKFVTEVARGGLALNLLLDGSSEARAVDFGDALNYVLNYKNQGTEILENVELQFALAAIPVVDGQSAVSGGTLMADPAGAGSGGKIIWDKKKISKLAKLFPGDEGTINLRVKLRDGPFLSPEKDYKVTAAFGAKIGKAGNLAKNLIVEGSPFISPILSDARLASEAGYYNKDGAALGSGPLPPKVGQTTTYRIFWEVSNSLHEIENIEVSTVLPENATYAGIANVEAGELKYDDASRRLTWKLNRLPLSVPKIGINFELALTPAAADAGKAVVLTGGNFLTAKDTFNGGLITRTNPALATNLISDPEAAGKGVVQN